jgi:DNA primase
MNKNFLEKLKKYYKEKYEITHSYKREKFDISTISICEVISWYISLPKSLKRNIRCPLHKDKTASFRIYSNTQSFYCFWCHKWGNIVNFVSEIENISPKEAFKKLAQIYSNNK